MLLKEAGYVFKQQSSPFQDPDQPPSVLDDPEGFAIDLALQKAQALAASMDAQDVLILSADTLCVGASGQILGKPTDAHNATEMLYVLENSYQTVISGVCLLAGTHPDMPVLFSDAAKVVFHAAPDGLIDDYVRSQKWRGKAGGYNLFELQELGWQIEVEGDPATVVGLPMQRLAPLLRASLQSG